MIEDHEARARALDPNCSFIVQAPAGSGKTTLLAHRVLRLLTTVEFPEQVVAITFTRKAAEEMRSRIIGALELARGVEPADEFERTNFALAQATLEHDERLEWDLIAQPSRLRIMTIDALCASLVRQMPVTARISGVQIVDDDAQQLYQEAARNTLGAIAEGGELRTTVARMLHHVDNDWAKLERLLAEMLERRDQWLRVLAVRADRSVLENSFARVVEYELMRAADLIPEEIKTQLIEVCNYAGENIVAASRSRITGLAELTTLPAAQFEQLDQWHGLADLLLTKDGKWRKRIDKTIGFPPDAANSAAQKGQLAAIIATLSERSAIRPALRTIKRLPIAAFDENEWDTCGALVVLMKAAAAHLMLVAERRGRTDFVAVAMAANEALGANEAPSDLALRMDYRVQHLLVDEFQDTSLTQLELIERLTAGWTGEDGRTLFLVGDPMQSIYRFRQADVRLFTNVLERGLLGSVPLDHVQLTETFRSQAGLVEWVNQAIPPALGTVNAFDVPFSEQHAVKAHSEPAFHTYPAAMSDDDAEAAQILNIVSDLRSHAGNASIAILVRSRTHLGRITSRLLENGYRVAAQEIQPLAERPWICDLLALTRALVHPADRIAWLATLRAPWCGLSLASLHGLASQPATLLQAMCDDHGDNGMEAGDVARLCRVRDVLAHAVNVAGTRPLAELVEHTWFALGGPACVEHDDGFNDVRTFFVVLAEIERDGMVPTAERIERRISELFSVTQGARADAIEVMTIHRAKGLEFDYVIIPGAGRKPRSEQKRLLLWREDVDHKQRPALLMAPIPQVGANALYDYLRARETDETAAEAVRLLYVAVTRARRAVHLLGHARCDRAGEPAPLKGSFIAMLWPVLKGRFEAYFESSTDRDWVEPDDSSDAIELRRLDFEGIGECAAPWRDDEPLGDTDILLEFDWAGATAKHVGTVAHRLLQELGTHERTAVGPAWMSRAMRFARGRLRALGVAEDELDGAARQVSDAVDLTLSSEQGRWLFSIEHTQSSAEMPLSTFIEGRLVHAIIDRSFVDSDGRRWIVDFKTGRHTGGSLDTYLDSEVARYRPQLERYGRILAGLDRRPIMLGLYFPLLDAWREWRYERT